MEDLVKELFAKIEKIQSLLQDLVVRVASMEARYDSRLQQGNDRFEQIEKQLETITGSHANCEMRNDPALQQFRRFWARHQGDVEGMTIHWVDKKQFLKDSGRKVTDRILDMTVTAIITGLGLMFVYYMKNGGHL